MPYEIPACAGKPYQPSNGTEGMHFMERYCFRCRHDDSETPFGEEGACDILGRTVRHMPGDDEYPAEWTHDERGRPICTAFEEEDDDPCEGCCGRPATRTDEEGIRLCEECQDPAGEDE